MNYIIFIAIIILIYLLLNGKNLMEHAAGSPGTLIQLATSTTEYPNSHIQTLHDSRGYVFPTHIHNDWDPYTHTLQRGHRHHPDQIRDLGYSYGGVDNSVIYVLVIVALMGYIIYKK